MTFYGMARNVNIINVKVLGDEGQGSVSNVIAGLQWTVNNAKQYNVRVINLSLGHPVCESYTVDPLCQAVEAAYKAGIVVVCAAGNDGRLSTVNNPALDNEGWGTNYGSIQCPGNDPYVITVGAMKSMDSSKADDRIATYSSRGPSALDLILKPDIVAPGNQVISTNTNNSYLANTYGSTNEIPYSIYTTQNAGHLSTDYFCLSGTSMASPVVAGAAALLLQANPKLTPDTVKARLMISADKWINTAGLGDPLTYGAGYVDVPAALACTVVAAGPAISPNLTISSSDDVSIDISRAVWGSSLWGTGVADLRAVWGSEAVYSSGTTSASGSASASRAVWGSNVIQVNADSINSGVWTDTSVSTCSSAFVDLSSTAIKGDADSTKSLP